MNSSQFYCNHILWTVLFVDPYNPVLVDRTNQLRVATTDPLLRTVYLSRNLTGDFLQRVLLHELGHVVMISYNLLDDLHRMVAPRYWVEIEEWACNFMADYGSQIFQISSDILQNGGV